MGLDFRANGTAFKTRTLKIQAAQFTFQEMKASLLGSLHPRYIQIRRGVDSAKAEQQVLRVLSKSRRAGVSADLSQETSKVTGWRSCACSLPSAASVGHEWRRK
jgi:hypothetical protein